MYREWPCSLGGGNESINKFGVAIVGRYDVGGAGYSVCGGRATDGSIRVEGRAGDARRWSRGWLTDFGAGYLRKYVCISCGATQHAGDGRICDAGGGAGFGRGYSERARRDDNSAHA